MEDKKIRFKNRYKFRYKETKKNVMYFECIEYNKSRCKARGQEKIGQEFIVTTDHNHLPKEEDPEQLENFKMSLKNACASSFDVLRPLYDEKASTHTEAANFLPYNKITGSMRRWRRKTCPPCPRNLEEYSTVLNSERWNHLTQHETGNITVTTFPVPEGGQVSVMADVNLLQSITTDQLLIDATFDVCPRTPEKMQLLTIMACINDTFEPICWAFMNRKTTSAYELVLRQFSRWAPHIHPEKIYTDFDGAQINAAQAVYPEAQIVRCYFHYLQSLLRNLKKKGKEAMQRLNKWPQGKVFFRKLQALPLFPARSMNAAFNWLYSQATPEELAFFGEFLTYVKNHWLGTVGAHDLSVFGLTLRTNNPMEAYNGTLVERIGYRPGIWKFTNKLVKIFLPVVRCEIEALKRFITVRDPPKRKYQIHERVLQYTWQLFDEQLIDIPTFFSSANHFLNIFNNPLIFTSPEEVDDLRNSQLHDIRIQPRMDRIEMIEMNEEHRFPILMRPENGHRVEIFLFRSLEMSLCRLCAREKIEFSSIPCNHWYACWNCVNVARQRAVEAGANLVCDVCRENILAFKRNFVS